MKALWILGGICLVLFILSLVRVGGRLEYGDGRLVIAIRLGAFQFTVYPFPKRKKKPRPAKEKPPQEPPKPQPKQGGDTFELIKRVIPVITEAASGFKRKIQIDQLDLDIAAGAPDPALAALAFGGVNAFLSMLVPLLEHNFNIKERRFRTMVDYGRAYPALWAKAAFSITIGQAVVLSLRLLVKFLSIFRQYKSENTQKEAV